MKDFIDTLAANWLKKRMEKSYESDPDIDLKIREIIATENETKIKGDTSAVQIIAQELGQLLEENNIENFIVIDLWPSIKHIGVQKPIKLTIQWANRKSPEQVLAEKEARMAELEEACLATMEAFDGIYGGDYRNGDIAPIDTMTPDRQAACNKALELVGRALEN